VSFARDLRAARKAAQLTQADAAKVCGVGKRTFEKWEAGELSPPPEAGAITRERVLARLAPGLARLKVSRDHAAKIQSHEYT